MRIDGKTQVGMDIVEQFSRKKDAEKLGNKEEVKTYSAVKSSDAVTISGKAKEAASLSKALKDLPEVRKEKVSMLKEKLADGSYSAAAKDIAAKIVANASNGLF